ncbi:DUF2273 domain-containing protein [Fusobacterium perfoetens]|uniref:DUF2273 domain-containing protein n=1 Tax=Fusobacterium perfoetens TaxID=852 RepID=UPI0015A18C73|nr:DUF2273 domain-containing protein [Fusobacterium perfoetens]MCF2625442.1 DUF2273 domain-containing protein [Fusobacterium perfoetens]
MLEDMIVSFIENRKKIFGAVAGFIIAVLLVEYGLISTIFILLVTYLGYRIGDSTVIKKIKKKIIERLQD